MAYSGNPIQNNNPSPKQAYSQTQVETNVYDLDDPYLVPKIQQHQYPKVTASGITCRFLAIPVNEPYAFFHDMAQYGHIIHESQNKLIMRLPHHKLDLLNRVRQAWVSKYLAPFTECRITFDVPNPGGTTLVIIQRVLPKIEKSGADDGNGTADLDAATDSERTALLPESSGEDTVPHLVWRRRATSLPLPRVLEEMSECPG